MEDEMRKLGFALATVAALGFSAPAFARDASSASQGHARVAAADVNVKVKSGRHHDRVKKMVIKRDRGLHRGWAHSRHYGATKKVVIKKHPGGTVVKKKIVRHS